MPAFVQWGRPGAALGGNGEDGRRVIPVGCALQEESLPVLLIVPLRPERRSRPASDLCRALQSSQRSGIAGAARRHLGEKLVGSPRIQAVYQLRSAQISSHGLAGY